MIAQFGHKLVFEFIGNSAFLTFVDVVVEKLQAGFVEIQYFLKYNFPVRNIGPVDYQIIDILIRKLLKSYSILRGEYGRYRMGVIVQQFLYGKYENKGIFVLF